jgi:hypothetical protein
MKVIFLAFFALLACSDGSSSDESEQITIAGTLVLSSDVQDDPEIEAGDALEGATVFLKGLPDVTATTDATGAFVLNIPTSTYEGSQNENVSTSLIQTEDSSNLYSIVLWKTTDAGALYGTQLDDVEVLPNETKELGDVELTYTAGVHFYLTDEAGDPIPDFVTTCEMSYRGYEGKITVYEDGARLSSTYMPAAEYTVDTSCTGYEDNSYTFNFPTNAPTRTGMWENITISMSASAN